MSSTGRNARERKTPHTNPFLVQYGILDNKTNLKDSIQGDKLGKCKQISQLKEF